MGDRAQVRIRTEKWDEKEGEETAFGEVYLYSHWGGTNLPNTVALALTRGQRRWNDSEYLARIIFAEMIQEDVLGETGFGIGLGMHGDIEHPLIEVDCEKKVVRLIPLIFDKDYKHTLGEPVEVPFQEVIDNGLPEIDNKYP